MYNIYNSYSFSKNYDNCYTIEFIDHQINPYKYKIYEPYAENDINVMH